MNASRPVLFSVSLLCSNAVMAGPTLCDSGDSARLFGYSILAGHETQFEDGYRRHLDWHRAHHDPLVWYGWYVVDGRRKGMFVDGSFGAPQQAFEHRVALSDDVEDANHNVNPHVMPQFKDAYRVDRALSTDTRLERWMPSAVVRVLRLDINASCAKRFPSMVLSIGRGRPAQTWYVSENAATKVSYLVMMPKSGEGDSRYSGDGLAGLLGTEPNHEMRRCIVSSEAETWAYRDDLSLIPDD